MMMYTEIVATEYNFPNITIFKKLKDGVHYAWRVATNSGYVMYDTTSNTMDYDEEGNAFPVTYYYTVAHCPLNYKFGNFSWVTVPRESVPKDMIFGDNNDN